MPIMPIVWTIAGSDSGGGAGIQADLHTFRSFNVHGCSVITSVTAQNSVETTAVAALTAETMTQQLTCLQQDLPPAAIKIGLLSNTEQLRAITQFIAHWPSHLVRPFIVWDPVIISTQDDRLSQLTPEHCHELLPLIDLLTPNVSELSWLTDTDIIDPSSLQNAANTLIESGLEQLLVTGMTTQSGEHIYDQLMNAQSTQCYFQQRINTHHSHGTGCTLSSAIAAVMAHHYPIEDALSLASAYVHQGLKQSKAIGKGPGPIVHTHWPDKLSDLPSLNTPEGSSVISSFPALDDEIGLYPVVDSFEWVAKLLPLGITTLQLRIKDAPQQILERDIVKSVRLARTYGAQLFINDHWELAIKHGAYGVHLGQEDLFSADLKAIKDAHLRLGISTHSYTEIRTAYAYRPSYIALGHVFPTKTKQMPSKPQGLERLKQYVNLLAPLDIPTVAIGGISIDKVSQVCACGVSGVAVVSAIAQASNTEQAVRDLQLAISHEPEPAYVE